MGATMLGKALEDNTTLIRLDLEDNNCIGNVGATALTKAHESTKNLQVLGLRNVGWSVGSGKWYCKKRLTPITRFEVSRDRLIQKVTRREIPDDGNELPKLFIIIGASIML
eukprot:scaffold208647_cov48-Attheya_sp.AAC.1